MDNGAGCHTRSVTGMPTRMCPPIRQSQRRSHLAALTKRPRPMTIKSMGLIAALALAGVACGTKDAPGPLAPGQTGRIRFVNLITDPARNPLNAVLENLPFGVNLGYGGTTPSSLPSPATANYSPILVGDRTLVLVRTADPTA